MKKIMIVFGTRPEVIKMAPIIRELKKYPRLAKPVILTTGQHKEMLHQIMSSFALKADYNLNIMRSNQTLFDVTARSLVRFKLCLERESPDMILVQGDTTTSFTAALAAYYLKIPIVHVEAGLRTYNKYLPFPEEMNRHLLSVLADIHFVPTQQSKNNLLKERIEAKKIVITGNTVIDALLMMVRRGKDSHFKGVDFSKKIVLVTAHRRESFGKDFEEICQALKLLVDRNADVEIVYPVHLNPNVQGPVLRILKSVKRIHLIPPVSYERFVQLMDRSYIVLTDSGGIQEEAPSLGKPVLVMRNVTERPEAVAAGAVKLVGTDKKTIVREAETLLKDRRVYKKMAKAINPYGDGKAAERIVKSLLGLSFKPFKR